MQIVCRSIFEIKEARAWFATGKVEFVVSGRNSMVFETFIFAQVTLEKHTWLRGTHVLSNGLDTDH